MANFDERNLKRCYDLLSALLDALGHLSESSNLGIVELAEEIFGSVSHAFQEVSVFYKDVTR